MKNKKGEKTEKFPAYSPRKLKKSELKKAQYSSNFRNTKPSNELQVLYLLGVTQYLLYQNENSLQAPANHRSGRVLSTSSKTCSPLPLWVNGSRQTIPVYGFQNGLPSKYFLPSVLKIFRKDGAPSPGCLLRIATANQSRLKVRFRLVK